MISYRFLRKVVILEFRSKLESIWDLCLLTKETEVSLNIVVYVQSSFWVNGSNTLWPPQYKRIVVVNFVLLHCGSGKMMHRESLSYRFSTNLEGKIFQSHSLCTRLNRRDGFKEILSSFLYNSFVGITFFFIFVPRLLKYIIQWCFSRLCKFCYET